jgi:hypothetical protein
MRYCFKVPPARYSTTTQHALAGKLVRAPPFELLAGILRSVVPIDAPTNCKQNYTTQLSISQISISRTFKKDGRYIFGLGK